MTDDLPDVSVERLAEAGLRLDIGGQASGVATVTLDRADKRNPQSPPMWHALRDIGRALPGDVGVVVLRAEGASFSAGLDLRLFGPEGIPGVPPLGEMARMDEAAALARIASYQEAFTWWRRPDVVSVAAVQGHAVGAGFQLALACDLRVVADDVQFAMAETSRGMVPDLGGTRTLVDLVGYPRALEICVTGRRVGADEAVRLGLAELAVPRGELDAAVQDLVAALQAAPAAAVSETKALLRGAGGRSAEEQFAAEREAQLRRIRDLAGVGGS